MYSHDNSKTIFRHDVDNGHGLSYLFAWKCVSCTLKMWFHDMTLKQKMDFLALLYGDVYPAPFKLWVGEVMLITGIKFLAHVYGNMYPAPLVFLSPSFLFVHFICVSFSYLSRPCSSLPSEIIPSLVFSSTLRSLTTVIPLRGNTLCPDPWKSESATCRGCCATRGSKTWPSMP